MAKEDFSHLTRELADRVARRKQMVSSSDRETEALEGIYDELTSLNALVAAIMNKMR